jgi:DNA-binding MarR family transcriptional regulator
VHVRRLPATAARDRAQAAADRRRHTVGLSAAGSGEVAQTYSQFGVVEDELFKALTADERAALYGLLSRAVEAVAPGCEPAACAATEPADCLTPEDGTVSG